MCGQIYALGTYRWGGYVAPIVQEAGWAPGPVWTGAENLLESRCTD